MLLPYDGLIFDCDGTLTDSMPLHYLGWKRTMDAHGIVFDEERFYALAGMPSDKIITLLAEEAGVLMDAKEVARLKEEAFMEYLHLLQPIEAIVQIARENRGVKKMAVASGGFRWIIEAQLKQIGILDWFDTIVSAEDTTKHKPEPDVFLEAARRLGVPAAKCLVYEDADLGIEAAKRSGMDFVDVRAFHQPKRWGAEVGH